MTRIVWLASYPKSGNTWFRLLAANLAAKEPVDINEMGQRGGIASARGEFEHHTLLDSGLLTHDEADLVRPRVYEAMAAGGDQEDEDSQPLRLVKAHDAYLPTASGEPLLAGARGAERAIVLVRDPRDVAPSLANHRHTTIDQAIDFMADRNATFAGTTRGQAIQFRQRLLDWGGHVASWLDQTDIPVHLVRYEDLKAAPVTTFTSAMAFAGRDVASVDAERAVDFSRFDRLQAQEAARGFVEWRIRGAPALFFRRGATQGWRSE